MAVEETQDLPHTNWYLEWEELNKVQIEQKNDKDEEPPWFKSKNSGERWIFRGEKRRKEDKNNISCVMQTKLERAFDSFKPNDKGYDLGELEKALIRAFQRKLYLYATHIPAADAKLEWLALMQHYGAPTRLLDWTYSFYVAVYFAVAELNCKKEVAEVWALNSSLSPKFQKMKQKIRENNKRKKTYNKLLKRMTRQQYMLEMDREKLEDNVIVSCLMDHPLSLIYAVNPFRLNERLTIQKGVFICPGNINKPFTENLKAGIKKSDLKKNLHRIVINFTDKEEKEEKKRNQILKNLTAMNIEQSVLFPDLSGFAKSLWEKLAYPEFFG